MYAHRAVLQCIFAELFTRWCFSQMIVLLLLRGLYKDLSFLHKAISSSVIQGVHRRTGRGTRGECSPPPPPTFGQLRFFGQQEKIWTKPVFFDYLLLRNGTPLTHLVENFASLLATASALSLKMNVSQNHALRSQRFQDFFTAINSSN